MRVRLANARATSDARHVLSALRSRKGFQIARLSGLLDDESVVSHAIADCQHPVSFAFLVPFVKGAAPPPGLRVGIDEAYLAPLRCVEPGSVKHVALVEVVRRAYKRWAMDADRFDKELRSGRKV